MATIPQNQIYLHMLADELMGLEPRTMTDEEVGRKLRAITMDLSRRPRVTDAPPRARRVTPKLNQQIRDMHRSFPDMRQQDISEALGVTAGRVSEALAGKRT